MLEWWRRWDRGVTRTSTRTRARGVLHPHPLTHERLDVPPRPVQQGVSHPTQPRDRLGLRHGRGFEPGFRAQGREVTGHGFAHAHHRQAQFGHLAFLIQQSALQARSSGRIGDKHRRLGGG